MKNLAEHLVGLFLHLEFYEKMNYRRLFGYSGVSERTRLGFYITRLIYATCCIKSYLF